MGSTVTFEDALEQRPWTLRTGEIVEPNKQGSYLLNTCRANLINPDHIKYLQLYALFKDGFLLEAGGVMHQPAIYIQAMRIIDSEVNKIHEREREAAKKKGGKR